MAATVLRAPLPSERKKEQPPPLRRSSVLTLGIGFTVLTDYTILLVDPDRQSRLILEQELKKIGHTVMVADGFSDGIEQLEIATPSLIISDIRFSEDSTQKDGFDLLEHVRQRPETKPIPFLFLSVHKSLDFTIRAFGAGAEDVISKPLKLSEIMPRIKVLLSQKSQPANLAKPATYKPPRTHSSATFLIPEFSPDLTKSSTPLTTLLNRLTKQNKSGAICITDGQFIGWISLYNGRVASALLGNETGFPALAKMNLWSEIAPKRNSEDLPEALERSNIVESSPKLRVRLDDDRNSFLSQSEFLPDLQSLLFPHPSLPDEAPNTPKGEITTLFRKHASDGLSIYDAIQLTTGEPNHTVSHLVDLYKAGYIVLKVDLGRQHRTPRHHSVSEVVKASSPEPAGSGVDAKQTISPRIQIPPTTTARIIQRAQYSSSPNDFMRVPTQPLPDELLADIRPDDPLSSVPEEIPAPSLNRDDSHLKPVPDDPRKILRSTFISRPARQDFDSDAHLHPPHRSAAERDEFNATVKQLREATGLGTPPVDPDLESPFEVPSHAPKDPQKGENELPVDELPMAASSYGSIAEDDFEPTRVAALGEVDLYLPRQPELDDDAETLFPFSSSAQKSGLFHVGANPFENEVTPTRSQHTTPPPTALLNDDDEGEKTIAPRAFILSPRHDADKDADSNFQSRTSSTTNPRFSSLGHAPSDSEQVRPTPTGSAQHHPSLQLPQRSRQTTSGSMRRGPSEASILPAAPTPSAISLIAATSEAEDDFVSVPAQPLVKESLRATMTNLIDTTLTESEVEDDGLDEDSEAQIPLSERLPELTFGRLPRRSTSNSEIQTDIAELSPPKSFSGSLDMSSRPLTRSPGHGFYGHAEEPLLDSESEASQAPDTHAEETNLDGAEQLAEPFQGAGNSVTSPIDDIDDRDDVHDGPALPLAEPPAVEQAIDEPAPAEPPKIGSPVRHSLLEMMNRASSRKILRDKISLERPEPEESEATSDDSDPGDAELDDLTDDLHVPIGETELLPQLAAESLPFSRARTSAAELPSLDPLPIKGGDPTVRTETSAIINLLTGDTLSAQSVDMEPGLDPFELSRPASLFREEYPSPSGQPTDPASTASPEIATVASPDDSGDDPEGEDSIGYDDSATPDLFGPAMLSQMVAAKDADEDFDEEEEVGVEMLLPSAALFAANAKPTEDSELPVLPSPQTWTDPQGIDSVQETDELALRRTARMRHIKGPKRLRKVENPFPMKAFLIGIILSLFFVIFVAVTKNLHSSKIEAPPVAPSTGATALLPLDQKPPQPEDQPTDSTGDLDTNDSDAETAEPVDVDQAIAQLNFEGFDEQPGEELPPEELAEAEVVEPTPAPAAEITNKPEVTTPQPAAAPEKRRQPAPKPSPKPETRPAAVTKTKHTLVIEVDAPKPAEPAAPQVAAPKPAAPTIDANSSVAEILKAAKKDLSNYKYRFALEKLAIAEAKDSTNGAVFYTKGLAHAGMGRYSNAVTALKRAISLGYNIANVYYTLGKSLRATGKTFDAKQAFRQFLKMEPTGQRAQEAEAFLSQN